MAPISDACCWIRNRPPDILLTADPGVFMAAFYRNSIPTTKFKNACLSRTKPGITIAMNPRMVSFALLLLSATLSIFSCDVLAKDFQLPVLPSFQNSYDLAANKGRSSFDVRHRFIFNYVWDLPFGKGKRYLSEGGIVDAVLGGLVRPALDVIHARRDGGVVRIRL